MNFDKPDALDILPKNIASDPPGDLLENIRVANDVSFYTGGAGSNSKAFTLMEIWGPIVDLANENGGDFENPGVYLSGSVTRASAPALYEKATKDFYSWALDNKDTLPPELQNITSAEIDERMKELVQSKEAEMAELVRTSPGLIPATARFIGSMGSAAFDPVTTATLPFGGWSKSFGKNLLQSAAINAGTGAYSEMAVKDWYDELGLEYGWDEFLRNVALQTAFGAALPVGVKGIQLTAAQTKKGWEVLSRSGSKPPSPEDEALAEALDVQQEDLESNPFESPEDPNEAISEHKDRLTKAQVAVENNTAPNITDKQEQFRRQLTYYETATGQETTYVLNAEGQYVVRSQAAEAATDNLDGVMFKIPARDVAIDAKRFQFKEGGDEYGVSERLQGITEWDPIQAGMVVFWEDAQGKTFIADGHQRAGLARRIMDQDPNQKINLIGYKLRETDGISAEKARVIAALSNISQGTGTVVDAAKVLRVDPAGLAKLPPMSSLVRQANDLVNLTDDAFGAIINEVIPSNYGAIVGRLIDDPDLQQAAINVLAKSDPSNAFQAEAIVRQVKDTDLVRETQVSLFGDEDIATSLYTERAKVLDRTYKILKSDKASFENLSRNAERIEAEGNTLVKDQNQRRADQDGQAITLLQALANRKGTLSDDLSAAAREAKDQGYAASARNFADAVRRGIERGDFDGAAAGDVGRAVDVAPQSRADAIEDEPTLEGFDEPTGPAAEAQVNQMVLDTFRDLEEVAEAKPVERSLKDRQPVETVDDIFEIAQESQDFIVGIGKSIESDLGVELKNPGLKEIDDANEKMRRKAYASAKELTDISRAGFIINKASDADDIVERLSENAEILDEGWAFTPAGYFDRKVLVRTPNGIVSEIQILAPKLYEAKSKKGGHKLYKQQRSSKDPAEVARLEKQQREIYSKALSEEEASLAKLVGMEKGPKVLSNVDIKAASSGITRPELRTSKPSTTVQEAPGASMARASDGEKETAGRPSQETRKVSDIDSTPDALLTDIADDIKPEDFDMEIPVSTVFDEATQENVPVARTLRDIKDDIDAEDRLINRLGVCGL